MSHVIGLILGIITTLLFRSQGRIELAWLTAGLLLLNLLLPFLMLPIVRTFEPSIDNDDEEVRMRWAWRMAPVHWAMSVALGILLIVAILG